MFSSDISPSNTVVSNKQMVTVAFFDVDKTILSCNSASLWISRELRLGYLSKKQYAQAIFWLGLYHLGVGRIEDFLRRASLWAKGESVHALQQRTQEFWETEVQQHIRKEAIESIRMHQEQGDIVVLLTSATDYLCELLVGELAVEHVLCNRFSASTDNVHISGVLTEPLCFGAGKVAHAQQFLDAVGGQWENSYFYTDSHSDAPVLEKVGYPKVVSPDPRLRRLAQHRNWTILEWK